MTLKKNNHSRRWGSPGGKGVGMYQVSSIELIMVLIMGEFGGGAGKIPSTLHSALTPGHTTVRRY